MLYEIATLRIGLGTLPAVLAGIEASTTAADARGQLLGCWTSEIGQLNEVYLLRGFADAGALEAERAGRRGDTNPFGCSEALSGLAFDSYAPFPFLPPVQPGAHGRVYEIRTYRLKHGGVEPTIAAWEAALPARTRLSPLVIAMYALDGPARFTHIWPFASLDARAAIRADSVKQGVWPPKGGPAWLTGDMRSTVALPAAFSPLR
jgi:hypothetical protein